jgi:hypothetical protein
VTGSLEPSCVITRLIDHQKAEYLVGCRDPADDAALQLLHEAQEGMWIPPTAPASPVMRSSSRRATSASGETAQFDMRTAVHVLILADCKGQGLRIANTQHLHGAHRAHADARARPAAASRSRAASSTPNRPSCPSPTDSCSYIGCPTEPRASRHLPLKTDSAHEIVTNDFNALPKPVSVAGLQAIGMSRRAAHDRNSCSVAFDVSIEAYHLAGEMSVCPRSGWSERTT